MRRALVLSVAALALCGVLLPGCLTKTENRPPTAVFTTSASAVNVGQKVVFDASNSSDKDGKIVKYQWDFGDSSVDMGVSLEHAYTSGGNFTVTLTVTDNEGGKDRTNATIRVNEYPRGRIDLSTTEAKVLAPVTFDGSKSTDPDGRVAGWFWDFGDGSNATGAQVAHAYDDVGAYTVNLTVTDDFGAKDSKSAVITVVLRTIDVTWNIVDHALPQVSEFSRENTTVNKTVPLLFDNMTMAVFQLTWVDDIRHWLLGAYNDDFALCVTDPANNTQYFREMAGNISLNFSLGEPPAPLTLTARSASEALAQVGCKYLGQVGRGNWSVSVVLGDAGGVQNLTDPDLDAGNSWQLSVRYFQYELCVTER